MANVGANGRDIFVVDNGDFVEGLPLGDDVFGQSHHGRVIVRGLDFRNADFKQVGEGAHHSNRSLIANAENGESVALAVRHILLQVSDDTRVGLTAHALV